MDITSALSEAMTEAFKNNGGRSTLIAIPLALAPRAANDFAQSHRFQVKTAEEILCDEYREEKMEERGVLIYEYFPTLMANEKNQLFMAHLRAYGDRTKKPILLCILLTQDAPLPDPSLLKMAWATELFQQGEYYEVMGSWQKVVLHCRKMISFLGLIPLGWGKKRLREWETSTCEQTTSVRRMVSVSAQKERPIIL